MKKNLAKLLAVSVSMGMLTACGGNGGKTETTAAETKAAETTAAETKAEETKETETTAAEKEEEAQVRQATIINLKFNELCKTKTICVDSPKSWSSCVR